MFELDVRFRGCVVRPLALAAERSVAHWRAIEDEVRRCGPRAVEHGFDVLVFSDEQAAECCLRYGAA